jgi:sialic acid synthase SpsE
MRRIKIKEYDIGEGCPPFFIAELGICHEGRVEVALELTRAAVVAGANGIKTESFQRDRLVFDDSVKMSYTINGKKITTDLIAHMDKYQLSFDDHLKVKRLCDELDTPFICTAHDVESVDFLVDIGAAAVKVSSPDIVHYPLLRHIARRGVPVFLDSGASFQYEVELAVKTMRDEGHHDIIVNHSPSGHPAPAQTHNLRILKRYRDLFDLPVGISDHYEGYDMVYAAALIGADAIEKPVSRDRFVLEPERNFSISAPDIAEVIGKMRLFHQALGQPERALLSESEREYRYNNRTSCVAARALQPGDTVGLDTVKFCRPHKGIGVEHWDLVAGRKIRRPLNENAFILWEDLD